MSWTCPNCGLHIPREVVLPVHCICEQGRIEAGLDPAWVSLVRRFRKPEDVGVGDTVQRIAARFGGERFKKWSKRLGIPCGCTARQADWNARWPY